MQAVVKPAALLMFLAALCPATARPDVAVDLELVLAVDVSGSIDVHEAKLQREGYVAALTHPEVMGAIQGGMMQRIAVTYVEWAGEGHQRILADWHLIENDADANAFALRLSGSPIATGRFTSISSAITQAVPMFRDNGFEGMRQVIDISGDGPNNIGWPVTGARDMALAEGVTINGLPIINNRPNVYGFPSLPNLDLYYEDCVIGGPGAFLIVAQDFDSFAAAIRRKLVLEIADLPPPAPSARRLPHDGAALWPAANGGQRPPCDIGERQIERFYRYRDDPPL